MAAKKLQLQEIRYYPDPEAGDEVATRLVVDNKSVLLGDWYHDKVGAQIKGFKRALEHLGIPFEILPSQQLLKSPHDEVWE